MSGVTRERNGESGGKGVMVIKLEISVMISGKANSNDNFPDLFSGGFNLITRLSCTVFWLIVERFSSSPGNKYRNGAVN